MATSVLDEKTIRKGEIGTVARYGQSVVPDLWKDVAGEGRLYYCVVDRLAYSNLDAALAHIRIQHGHTDGASSLLRARLAGWCR